MHWLNTMWLLVHKLHGNKLAKFRKCKLLGKKGLKRKVNEIIQNRQKWNLLYNTNTLQIQTSYARNLLSEQNCYYLTSIELKYWTLILNKAVELLLTWMIEWVLALYFPKLDTNWGTSVRRQVQRKRLIKIWKLLLCRYSSSNFSLWWVLRYFFTPLKIYFWKNMFTGNSAIP